MVSLLRSIFLFLVVFFLRETASSNEAESVEACPNPEQAPAIPIIDISGLFGGSREVREATARQIGEACRDIG